MADNGPTQRWEDVLTGDVLELCLDFAGSLSTYRAMRVCVLWANVASRPSLHRTLSLHAAREGQVGCDLQSDCFTNVALRRCLAMGRVQEISLSGFQGLSAECFGDLRKQAPDLLALSLFNCPQIDDQSLLPILPSKLAYLQMHQCCRRIPGSLLWLTSNLQSLDLAFPRGLTLDRCGFCEAVMTLPSPSVKVAARSMGWGPVSEVELLRGCAECGFKVCWGGNTDCAFEAGLARCALCSTIYCAEERFLRWGANHQDEHLTLCMKCDGCEAHVCSDCAPVLRCSGCRLTLCDACVRRGMAADCARLCEWSPFVEPQPSRWATKMGASSESESE